MASPRDGFFWRLPFVGLSALGLFSLAENVLEVSPLFQAWVTVWRTTTELLWSWLPRFVDWIFDLFFPVWIIDYLTLCVIFSAMIVRVSYFEIVERNAREWLGNPRKEKKYRLEDALQLLWIAPVLVLVSPIYTPILAGNMLLLSLLAFVVNPLWVRMTGYESPELKRETLDKKYHEEFQRTGMSPELPPSGEEDEYPSFTPRWQMNYFQIALEENHRIRNYLIVFWESGLAFLILLALNYAFFFAR